MLPLYIESSGRQSHSPRFNRRGRYGCQQKEATIAVLPAQVYYILFFIYYNLMFLNVLISWMVHSLATCILKHDPSQIASILHSQTQQLFVSLITHIKSFLQASR